MKKGRGGSMVMSAVATVLSHWGAAHVLQAIPIPRGNLDAVISDSHLRSAPQNRTFYLKPWPFLPGSFGNATLFECNFSIACINDFYRPFLTVSREVSRAADGPDALGASTNRSIFLGSERGSFGGNGSVEAVGRGVSSDSTVAWATAIAALGTIGVTK